MLLLNYPPETSRFSKYLRVLYKTCTEDVLKRFLTLVVFSSFILLNISAPEAQQLDSGQSSLYQFGAGDVLEVLVFGEPEISKTVFVRNDGRISLPLIGELMAAGSTTEALSKKNIRKAVKGC